MQVGEGASRDEHPHGERHGTADLRCPCEFPFAIGIAVGGAGEVPDRGGRCTVHLRLYPRNAALAGEADDIHAPLPVGTELHKGPIGECHAENRRTSGHPADLELQHAPDILAAEIGPHLVELRGRKRATENLDQGGDFPVRSHVDMKLRIPGQMLAELPEVTDEFVGVTIPDIAKRVGGDVVSAVRKAGVEKAAQFIQRLFGSLRPGGATEIVEHVVYVGLNDDSADVADLFALVVETEWAKLHERPFENGMFFGEKVGHTEAARFGLCRVTEECPGGQIITYPSSGGEALRAALCLPARARFPGGDPLFKIPAGRRIMYDQTVEITGLQVFDDGPAISDRYLTS